MKPLLWSSVFLLAGCVSTASVNQRIADRYSGRSLDEFALERGSPALTYQLQNGDRIFSWRSNVAALSMPATTTTTGYASPYGYNATSTTYGGSDLHMFCAVDLRVGASGIVQSVRITADTIGMWTTSRCGELFKSR